MNNTLLQILGTIIVGIISAGSALIIAAIKTKFDNRVASVSASDALRDDLLTLLDKYEQRETKLNERLDNNEKRNGELQDAISELRTQIDLLRQENADLRQENKALKVELQRTRKELEQFNKNHNEE